MLWFFFIVFIAAAVTFDVVVDVVCAYASVTFELAVDLAFAFAFEFAFEIAVDCDRRVHLVQVMPTGQTAQSSC